MEEREEKTTRIFFVSIEIVVFIAGINDMNIEKQSIEL